MRTIQDEAAVKTPIVRLGNCTVTVPAAGSVKTLKQTLLRREASGSSERVLLHDINLCVEPGERVGIIGGNGAGKTTLLRLIAGIFPPRSGARIVNGTVAAVLALGRGLDPELSLRANVTLGLIQSNRSELYSEELVAKILEFATLSDRAHEPMRRLSAGLQARFAFSLSIHQSPDILILDEIFTIGDAGFVEKAIAAMMDRVDASPILFIASHSESEIREICSRSILIDDGRIVMDSDPASVFVEYRKTLSER
jgi:lipopolysaccharide transport system ATP-binding protein